jgi:hypothetical protein
MPSSNSRVRGEQRTAQGKQRFSFPDEIPIDPVSTLDQLTSRFRGVKDGLPEIVKNSKDQYSRLGIFDADDRQIVVLIDTASRRIGVLDFAGAPLANFEGWTRWSDPTAGRAERAADIEAGHGNGGKAFMVRGATDFAFMESCFEGRRTRKGFLNHLPAERYKPGFSLLGGEPVCNVAELDPSWRLRQFLSHLAMDEAALPAPAFAIFKKRSAYTGVLLSKVADWSGKRKDAVARLARESIPELLASHGQTALTIDTCNVWVVVDGSIVNGGMPIKAAPLDPYPGFEEPLVFPLPDILTDPETGDGVDVSATSSGERKLVLKTSARQLRITAETKAKNVIRVWNARNNVATWPLPSLGILPASIGFIYGEIHCPALVGEHLAGADRIHLSDTSLTRALRQWTTDRVRDLAEALHQAMLTDSKPKDREQARSALSSIRDLMRRYLEPEGFGDLQNGDDGSAGSLGLGRTRYRTPIEFGDRIDVIELEGTSSDICVVEGTTVPLNFRCMQIGDDGRVRPVRSKHLRLCNSSGFDWGLDDGGNLNAREAGIACIWLETADSSVRSNEVEVWVSRANGVEAELPRKPLMQGQSLAIPFTFHTTDGPLEDALIEAHIDDPNAGKIGRKGRFTAGSMPGPVTLRIRYGRNETDVREFSLAVGHEKVPPPEGRGQAGSDVPLILFCGDDAPGKEGLPPDQRTIPGGPKSPTIIEDPMFPSVVWINDSSKESVRVRKSKGGSSGVGRVVSRTFIHFVALKCFDILKRLYVRQRISGTSVTEYQYIQYSMEAEMDCADFVDAAWELSDQLLGGTEATDV